MYNKLNYKKKRDVLIISMAFFFLFLIILIPVHNKLRMVTNSGDFGIKQNESLICIRNNSDFIAYSSQGNGSQVNPYIIENKVIYGNDSSKCIWISNTSSYFILRFCLIYEGTTGIYLDRISNGQIVNNTIRNSQYSMYISHCINILISNNTIFNVNDGIFITYSQKNTVIKNIINSSAYNIRFINSRNCIFTHNTLNGTGLYLTGNFSCLSSHEINSTNSLNARQLYYYVNKTCLNPINFTNGAQIILMNCNFSRISNLNIYNVSTGITLHYSHNNTISNVNTFHNGKGIHLEYSSNNTITNNTVNSNRIGIFSEHSNNNLISNNTINSSRGFEGINLARGNFNKIQNNIIYHNYRGIYLSNAKNNTVLHNIANFNDIGFSFYHSANNSVLDNTANNNTYSGIELEFSDCNYLFNNSANNNFRGILLGFVSPAIINYEYPLGKVILYGESNNNKISNNTVNHNYIGISIYYSDNNSILFNTANNNEYYGIALNYSNYNSIAWNILHGNALCIYEFGCINNIIESNDCHDRIPPIPGFSLLLILLGLLFLSCVPFSRKREAIYSPSSFREGS